MLTHNPLGSPDILGLNSGAFTGVVIVMTLRFESAFYDPWEHSPGVGDGDRRVFARSSTAHRADGLVIVGIACSAALGSVNTMVILRAGLDDALQLAAWNAGGLSTVNWEQLGISVLLLVPFALCVPVCDRWLRQLALGDEFACANGVLVERAKVITVVVDVALSACVTAVAGRSPSSLSRHHRLRDGWCAAARRRWHLLPTLGPPYSSAPI